MRTDDFNWFVSHYDELYQTYGRSFLAVKDRQVFGVYDSFAKGVREAGRLEKPGTFILQECNGSEDAYTADVVSMNFMD